MAASNSSSSLFSWGIALAAISLLTVGGGSLIWNQRHSPPTEVVAIPTGDDPVTLTRVLPRRLIETEDMKFHTITYGVENGTAIVKIRVVAQGDELIVDASTGRLLETRPSRPTAPRPMGKFAAPFSPMM